jgi:hypothetical protein
MRSIAITRRDVLNLIVGCAIAGFPRNRANADEPNEPMLNTLLRIARRMYPHDALDDSVYLDILEPLQVSAAADPTITAALNEGRDSLDTAAGGDWLAADIETQIAALESIENSAFFETVRNTVRTELYSHPEVWELIGFEGSSVEYGGYIERGFNDIDWLPED